jgi:hypothetical protein
MSSLRQIEANRRNAQKSTGPKTAQGKNKTRFNAVVHGLTAERFVVAHEDESEFDAFREDFFAEHQPAGPTETFLVEQMIAAAWRIRRIRNTEAAFWNLKMAENDESVEAEYDNVQETAYLAHAMEYAFGSKSSINNLSRYEARLERAFYKALHELERLRRERPAQQIGFVSQKLKIVPQRPPEPPETVTTPPTLQLQTPTSSSALEPASQ